MNTLKTLLLTLLLASSTLYSASWNVDCDNTTHLNTLHIPKGDCQALEAIWHAFGEGEGWIHSDHWGEATVSAEEWYGITLNDDNTSVYKLKLRDNNLTGEIPDGIGLFTDIRWLMIYLNPSIGGTIPENIKNLTSLELLQLRSNSLIGPLPSFSGMINLKFLLLSANNFSGAIPIEYGNLTSLEKLDLSKNHFTGSIPKSFENLTKMTHFLLSENELSGEIISVENIPDMYMLDIQENNYTSKELEEGKDTLTKIGINNNNNRIGIYAPQTYRDVRTIYFEDRLVITPKLPDNTPAVGGHDYYVWSVGPLNNLSSLEVHSYTYTKENATSEDAGQYVYDVNNSILTLPDSYHGIQNLTYRGVIQAIHDNTPAVSNLKPETSVTAGETYTYTSNISDADKDELNVTAGILPSWLSLTSDASSFTLTGTPDDGSAGDYDINITVTDGKIPVHISYTLHVNPSGDSLPNGFTETNGVYSHDSTHNSITGAANLAIVNNGLELTEACSGTVGAFAELDSDGKLLTGYQNCSTHARTQTLTTPYPGNAHASLLSDSILVELPLTQDITIGEN